MLELEPNDLQRLRACIVSVNEARKNGVKAKQEIQISCGAATVYHLGAANPTVRVDIKVKEEN